MIKYNYKDIIVTTLRNDLVFGVVKKVNLEKNNVHYYRIGKHYNNNSVESLCSGWNYSWCIARTTLEHLKERGIEDSYNNLIKLL